jgi:hypothetical protein
MFFSKNLNETTLLLYYATAEMLIKQIYSNGLPVLLNGM